MRNILYIILTILIKKKVCIVILFFIQIKKVFLLWLNSGTLISFWRYTGSCGSSRSSPAKATWDSVHREIPRKGRLENIESKVTFIGFHPSGLPS